MHISLRNKYKLILAQADSDEQSSSRTYFVQSPPFQPNRRSISNTCPPQNLRPQPPKQMFARRILTEVTNTTTDCNLDVKAKLAQSILNNHQKQQQILRLKQQSRMKSQQNVRLVAQINALEQSLQQKDQEINTHLNEKKSLQQALSQLKQGISQGEMEKCLLVQQIEHYQSEISVSKQKFEAKALSLSKLTKDISEVEKIKSENERLKIDLNRVLTVLGNCYRFGKIKEDLVRKHFVGTPHKESQYWCSESLFAETQCFLKKKQVGYGQKDFTTSLVKFIQSYTNKMVKEQKDRLIQKNIKVDKYSKIDKDQSKRTASLQTESGAKSKTYNIEQNYFGGSRLLKTFNQQKNYTEKLKKTIFVPKINNWNSVTQILDEFISIMDSLMEEKEIKRKKIKKIIQQMCCTIKQIVEENNQF